MTSVEGGRVRDPEGTLEKLLDAALTLFGEAGYERATVDRIVAAAGYSKGAFYSHFKSKEEMFLYILERRLERNLEQVVQLCRVDGSAGAWLKHVLRTLLDLSEDRQGVRALSFEFMAYGMRDGAVGARIAAMHQAWRALFAETLTTSVEYAQGRLVASPAVISYALVALVDGFIVQLALETDRQAKERLLRDVEPLLDAWFLPPERGEGADPIAGEVPPG